MSKFSRTIAFTLSVGLCAAGLALAAKPKPKAKPKPVPKKTTTQPHYVQGTKQLSGENAVFGTVYTLGKLDSWNLNVKSAEYTVEPLLIGDRIYIPKGDQKLLVIHFNAHNPQKQEALLRFDTVAMTCVDAKDQNWEYIADLGGEKDKEIVSVSAKPAQKMDVYTAILVPAAVDVPKLIIKSSDETVLRYDLRGKIKGLQAPFADPNDKTGATALQRVSAQMGTYYPTGYFDFKLDSVSYSDKPVGDQELAEGSRNLVLIATARNRSKDKPLLRFDTFSTKLTDADGADVGWNQNMYSASRNATVESTLDPGQELRFRYACPAPNDLQVKSFAISELEGRTYVYDLSGVK